ncbi:hypothetical protein HY230_05970 [Candidatus Acetothermia bacterium]|nr:hypothetical protein [Candidatus Acetothermia bacterium]
MFTLNNKPRTGKTEIGLTQIKAKMIGIVLLLTIGVLTGCTMDLTGKGGTKTGLASGSALDLTGSWQMTVNMVVSAGGKQQNADPTSFDLPLTQMDNDVISEGQQIGTVDSAKRTVMLKFYYEVEQGEIYLTLNGQITQNGKEMSGKIAGKFVSQEYGTAKISGTWKATKTLDASEAMEALGLGAATDARVELLAKLIKVYPSKQFAK